MVSIIILKVGIDLRLLIYSSSGIHLSTMVNGVYLTTHGYVKKSSLSGDDLALLTFSTDGGQAGATSKYIILARAFSYDATGAHRGPTLSATRQERDGKAEFRQFYKCHCGFFVANKALIVRIRD